MPLSRDGKEGILTYFRGLKKSPTATPVAQFALLGGGREEVGSGGMQSPLQPGLLPRTPVSKILHSLLKSATVFMMILGSHMRFFQSHIS